MSFRNALNKRTYAYVRVCACYVYVCMYYSSQFVNKNGTHSPIMK